MESVIEIGTVAEIDCVAELGVTPGQMSFVAIITFLARCQCARHDGYALMEACRFMDDMPIQVYSFIRVQAIHLQLSSVGNDFFYGDDRILSC